MKLREKHCRSAKNLHQNGKLQKKRQQQGANNTTPERKEEFFWQKKQNQKLNFSGHFSKCQYSDPSNVKSEGLSFKHFSHN